VLATAETVPDEERSVSVIEEPLTVSVIVHGPVPAMVLPSRSATGTWTVPRWGTTRHMAPSESSRRRHP